MKALLLILGLTLSLGAFAEGKIGEDQEGCGSSDELKGCKCIKQSIADKEDTSGSGTVEDKGGDSAVKGQ